MVLKVFLEFLLVIQIVDLSFLKEDSLGDIGWLIDPFDRRINKFVSINSHILCKESTSYSICLVTFFQLLPSSCIFGVLNIRIWLVVVLELYLLEMGNLLVLCCFLLSDILLLNTFSVSSKFSLSLQLRFHFVNWVLRECVCQHNMIFTVYDFSSLLHNSEITIAPRCLDVPHEFLLVALYWTEKFSID